MMDKASDFDIDRNTTLCLACSSSLPPLRDIGSKIYITSCCRRPICPSCISLNPRLSRYNPCLACLGGVDLIALGSRTPSSTDGFQSLKGKGTPSAASAIRPANIDGSLRDEDTFVLGDDEDNDQDLPPPPYVDVPPGNPGGPVSVMSPAEPSAQSSSLSRVKNDSRQLPLTSETDRTVPYKYYLNRQDTLQGIALRFDVDVYEICKMNNLPPSVLRTTPHLLHTRSFLKLPPTAKSHESLTLSPDEERRREDKLARERAEKRIQTLAKEEDWRVAKAYVALADDACEQDAFALKAKETGASRTTVKQPHTASAIDKRGALESLALNQYLEDEEWEQAERRAGRGVSIPNFPLTQRKKGKKST